MTFIDAHTHTFLRGPEDLARMAHAGVRAAAVCAFLPVAPSGAASLLDLLTWLDTVERARLDRAGIAMQLAAGIHPRSIPPEADIDRVLGAVRSMVETGRAAAIGEIGLETGSGDERALFLRQICLAGELGVPAIVHTPRANKKERLADALALIDTAHIAPDLVLLDHLTPESVSALDARGHRFWMGLTVQPGKATPEEVAALISARGPERLIVDSDLSHVPSDPCAVARTARRLGELGIAPGDIARVTAENAARLFGADRGR